MVQNIISYQVVVATAVSLLVYYIFFFLWQAVKAKQPDTAVPVPSDSTDTERKSTPTSVCYPKCN
jgi:hypothetical protein